MTFFTCPERAIPLSERSESLQQLTDRYSTVLGLYRELEILSQKIFDVFEGNARAESLQDVLRAKIAVVGRIQEESRAIAELKKVLTLTGAVSDMIRRAEEELTVLVKRVVEREDRSRALFETQGIRLTRTGCR